jgi:hypothetical protein
MKKKRSKDEIIICYNNKNSNIDIDSNYVKKDGEAKQLELIQKISLECDVGNDLLKADSEAVMTIISHLEGSEAEIISNLLYSHSLLLHEVLKLRKRNRDLVTQITTSLPNYTKIKEELATKFEEYLLQQGREKILLEVQHKKIIFELKRRNELLLTENIELKETNERLSQELVIVRGDLASLQIQLENISIANTLSDFFRYIRAGVIAKTTPSKEFPKPEDALKALRRQDEVDLDDVDDENVDQIKAEAQADQDARAFLSARNLNPDLMLDLYRLNYTSTHYCYSKLLPQKTITAVKNQAALNEVRGKVASIQAHHAAHHVKNGVLCMIDAYSIL